MYKTEKGNSCSLNQLAQSFSHINALKSFIAKVVELLFFKAGNTAKRHRYSFGRAFITSLCNVIGTAWDTKKEKPVCGNIEVKIFWMSDITFVCCNSSPLCDFKVLFRQCFVEHTKFRKY